MCVHVCTQPPVFCRGAWPWTHSVSFCLHVGPWEHRGRVDLGQRVGRWLRVLPLDPCLCLRSFWGHIAFAGVGLRSSSWLVAVGEAVSAVWRGWQEGARAVLGAPPVPRSPPGGWAWLPCPLVLWCLPAAFSPEQWGPSSLWSGGWSGREAEVPAGSPGRCLWCS